MKKIITEKDFYKQLKKITIISGGYFGDEAKGKIVESLLRREKTTFVIRTNSGANAGHTVVTDNGEKVVTHLVPSGITHKKIKNIINHNCFLDPIGFQVEVESLTRHKLDLKNLYIDNVFIVTPYHIIHDLFRGLASTGKGMTQVAQDKVSKSALKLEDLVNRDLDKISKNFKQWEVRINFEDFHKIESRCPVWIKEFLKIKNQDRSEWYLKEFEKYQKFYKDRFADGRQIFESEIKKGNLGVLEGAQSFYLSNDVDVHFSSSTASGTHAQGTLASFPIQDINSICTLSVIKLPSSRVGLGSNPSGLVKQSWFEENNITALNVEKYNIDLNYVYDNFINQINRKTRFFENIKYKSITGEYAILENGSQMLLNEALAIAQSVGFGEFGATTKRPRVTGFLDLPHIKFLVNNQGQNMILSCVDRYVGFNKIPIVVGYKYLGEDKLTSKGFYKKNKIINLKDILPGESILERCIPIYEVLDGWNNIVEKNKLNKNLEAFIEFIEIQTGARILAIGTGPKSSDIIYIK